MAEFPALPLWTDAYLGDTMHLDATEHGAYLLLLISAWRNDDTSLPNDDRLLARYARCTAKTWKRVRPVLEPFFKINDRTWQQLRLREEKHNVTRKRDKLAANGKASALKRKERHSAKRPTEREQSDQPSENKAFNRLHAPISISSSVPNGTGADAPIDLKKVAFDTGVVMLTANGLAEAKARRQVGMWVRERGEDWTVKAIVAAQGKADPVAYIQGMIRKAAVEEGQGHSLSEGTRRRYLEMDMAGPPGGSADARRAAQ